MSLIVLLQRPNEAIPLVFEVIFVLLAEARAGRQTIAQEPE
jgi:hypothetical protein